MTRPQHHDDRYSGIAIALHWLIAACFVGLLSVGFFMSRLGDDALSLKFTLYQWHKSFGITLLLLTVARIGWRLISPAPAPLASGWHKQAASAGHILLYSLTLFIPLAGWAMVSVSPWNIPTVLYGTIPWPHLPYLPEVADKQGAEAVLKLAHKTLAYLGAGLAVLHMFAALRHHFLLKDRTLMRMIPRLKGPRP